jgi:hypothetical protein
MTPIEAYPFVMVARPAMLAAGSVAFVILVGLFILAVRRQLVADLLRWLVALGLGWTALCLALIVLAVVITSKELT